MPIPTPIIITWTSTGTTSDAVDISGAYPVTALSLLFRTFTGTSITFTVSDTLAGVYVPLKDSTGAAVSYTVAANTGVNIIPKDLVGWRFLKIVSGSSEASGRTVTLFGLDLA